MSNTHLNAATLVKRRFSDQRAHACSANDVESVSGQVDASMSTAKEDLKLEDDQIETPKVV